MINKEPSCSKCFMGTLYYFKHHNRVGKVVEIKQSGEKSCNIFPHPFTASSFMDTYDVSLAKAYQEYV